MNDGDARAAGDGGGAAPGEPVTITISREGAESFVSDAPGFAAIGEQEVTEALVEELADSGTPLGVDPAWRPTVLTRLIAIADFCEAREGIFSLAFNGTTDRDEDARWSGMLTWGREAPDSPMAAAQALGRAATPGEVLDQIIGEARIDIEGGE